MGRAAAAAHSCACGAHNWAPGGIRGAGARETHGNQGKSQGRPKSMRRSGSARREYPVEYPAWPQIKHLAEYAQAFAARWVICAKFASFCWVDTLKAGPRKQVRGLWHPPRLRCLKLSYLAASMPPRAGPKPVRAGSASIAARFAGRLRRGFGQRSPIPRTLRYETQTSCFPAGRAIRRAGRAGLDQRCRDQPGL